MKISTIAAIDRSGRIGVDGDLLFDFPEDKRWFKGVTLRTSDPRKRNAVMMGYTTFMSIPKKFRPLPGRLNIVCTRRHVDEIKDIDGVHVCTDAKAVLNVSMDNIETLFIIGGEAIYRETITQSDTVYLNHILSESEVTTGDFKYFPMDEFHKHFVLESSDNVSVSKSGVAYIKRHYRNTKSHSPEMNYLNNLADILINGSPRETRSGVTISKFGMNMRFSLRDNTIPLLTTKKMFTRGILEELFWFLRGDVDSKHLEEKRVNIWKGNSSREYLDSIDLDEYRVGECGPIYGYQWRHFNAKYKGPDEDYSGTGVDQLAEVIRQIKETPCSRRMIMSAWNPCQLKDMCLPPCHVLYQFYVEDGYLYCSMYQRSGDMFLGIPFNIASTSFLTIMIAHITGLKPGGIYHTIGDAHIYKDHIKQVYTQLSRSPHEFPKCFIKGDVRDLEDFTVEHFNIVGYKCHPTIKAKMSV